MCFVIICLEDYKDFVTEDLLQLLHNAYGKLHFRFED